VFEKVVEELLSKGESIRPGNGGHPGRFSEYRFLTAVSLQAEMIVLMAKAGAEM
jgi:hypothetical protein